MSLVAILGSMQVKFNKYHALQNDFFIIELTRRMTSTVKSRLAEAICDRRRGVGADGVLYLSDSKKADIKVDLYNSDGSWAEKSGNGLRCVALHLRHDPKRGLRPPRHFMVEMGGTVCEVAIVNQKGSSALVMTDLGEPQFETKLVPVNS